MAQLVEHDLAKVGAAGSSPVSRFFISSGSGRMFFYTDVTVGAECLCPLQACFDLNRSVGKAVRHRGHNTPPSLRALKKRTEGSRSVFS